MCAVCFLVHLVVKALSLSFLLLTTQVTIHPVVTATSSAASTAMNAPSIIGLLLVSPVAGIMPVPIYTVVDISLVCVDCRQFVGVILEYSVVTVDVVEHNGAGGVAVTITAMVVVGHFVMVITGYKLL